MKKKFNYKIFIIIILVIVLIGMVMGYLNSGNSTNHLSNNSVTKIEQKSSEDKNETTSKISGTAEVSSSLTEKLELHATYYSNEIFVEENQKISKGEKILQYTNGEYLVAPYDCVIMSISIPNDGEQCTSKHYIEISSINNLQVSIKVSEEKINQISLGSDATVEIQAVEKIFEGKVVYISSTASEGYFTVKIEFENDGNVKLGMTAKVEIAI